MIIIKSKRYINYTNFNITMYEKNVVIAKINLFDGFFVKNTRRFAGVFL